MIRRGGLPLRSAFAVPTSLRSTSVKPPRSEYKKKRRGNLALLRAWILVAVFALLGD
jgi:hypothetical protein